MNDISIQLPWSDWQVTSELGHGSSGHVYCIERQHAGFVEKAACKVITFPRDNSEVKADSYDYSYEDTIDINCSDMKNRIMKEYELLLSLKGHPNIVNCDEICVIQHTAGIGLDAFIRMELLSPFSTVIQNDRQISEQTAIQLGKDICRALIACEQRHIIHGDIKPQNVLISRFGDFKLGDFGIARSLSQNTVSFSRIGALPFLAPELYRNKNGGTTVDIYSLGIMLYYYLNQFHMPFVPLDRSTSAAEYQEAIQRRMNGQVFPPPLHGNPVLKAVVMKACAYRPEDRFQHAREMYNALENAESVLSASNHHTIPRGISDQWTDSNSVTLYGCPTAKDTPGNVPACMLTTFEGLCMSEI